ncbi:MAG: extracellular solute-binding protein [Firmicutes bacterium]|nr:extracellular solute-binding protein [Bacillota bacterium]
MRGRVWTMVAAFAAVVLLVLVLAPRFMAQRAGDGSDSAELVFLAPPDLERIVQRLLDDFHREFPGIRVAYRPLSGSNDERRPLDELVANGGTAADVVAVDFPSVAAWQAAGRALELERFGAQSGLDEFLPAAARAVSVNDMTYGMPWMMDVGVLYYRRDLIEGAGADPPGTWQDLIALSRRFIDSGAVEWGFAFAGEEGDGLARLFLELLWANGGRLVDDGELAIDSPEAREALGFLRDLIHSHRVSPPDAADWSEEQSREAFLAEQALLLRHTTKLWTTREERQAAVERFGVAQLPAGPRGTGGAVSVSGLALVIDRDTSRPEAAWEFVRWLTGDEAQRTLALEGSRLPARVSVYNEPEVPAREPFFPRHYTIATNHGFLLPSYANWPGISRAIARNVHRVLNGELSIDEALARLRAELDPLIPPQARRERRETPTGIELGGGEWPGRPRPPLTSTGLLL